MYCVINSFEVSFHRHRIPLTLIPPLAISLLLEFATGKKKVNLFQMRFSVPGILFVSLIEDFLKNAKYLISGCYGSV